MGLFDWIWSNSVSEKVPATYLPGTPEKPLYGLPIGSVGPSNTDLASRIVDTMRKKGYLVFTEPGEVNIVYVEGMDVDGGINDDAPDRFNDLRLILRFDRGQPTIVGMWEATTEPGKYWTHNRMNPKGTARIAFGQYTAWIVGIHNGNHEGLVQRAGPVTVHRDTDENYIRPGDPMDTGYFGINHHHGYDLPKDQIGRASAGCLVGRSISGHQDFMRYVKSDPRYKRNPKFAFTATILPASEVL